MNTNRPYYTNPDAALWPGDRIGIKVGDEIIYRRITSIKRTSGEYTPAPPLSLWERIVRSLTLPRWRKPLPLGTRTPDSVELTTEEP